MKKVQFAPASTLCLLVQQFLYITDTHRTTDYLSKEKELCARQLGISSSLLVSFSLTVLTLEYVQHTKLIRAWKLIFKYVHNQAIGLIYKIDCN